MQNIPKTKLKDLTENFANAGSGCPSPNSSATSAQVTQQVVVVVTAVVIVVVVVVVAVFVSAVLMLDVIS